MRLLLSIFLAMLINLFLFLGMQALIRVDTPDYQSHKIVNIDYVKVTSEKNIAPLVNQKPKMPLPPKPHFEPPPAHSTTPPSAAIKQPQPIPLEVTLTPPKILLPKPHLGKVEKIRLKVKKKKLIVVKAKKRSTSKPQTQSTPKTTPKQPQIDSLLASRQPIKQASIRPTEPINPQPSTQWVSAKDLVSLVRSKPRYPRRLKKRRIQGYVVLEFTINSDGNVVEPAILESQPQGAFDKSVLRSIKRWKFRPKQENGKNIAVRTRQRIEFKLKR